MRSPLPTALLTLLLTMSGSVQSEPASFKTSGARVSLLELYTSEGCYSCPPADRWLSGLKDDPRLWKEVVPLAFHVDYWDYIGWPDRFASPEYSRRQKTYARKGGVGSVYTPGLVLAGREWRSWFLRPVLKVDGGDDVGPLELSVGPSGVTATFDPAAPPNKPLELHLAVLGFDFETEVTAGENDGKKLKHDFVVLGHTRVRMRAESGRLVAETALPKPRFESARKALAAWVSVVDDPRPIQAVGGWL